MTVPFGGSPGSILPGRPGAFGGGVGFSQRPRTSSPPLNHERARAALDVRAGGTGAYLSSFDFESLFEGDGDAGGGEDDVAGGDERLETVAEAEERKPRYKAVAEEEEEEQEDQSTDPLHCLRTVANLSRPRDALERNIARRFAAACKHVRSGELCQLCDAGSIEPLQRSFNGITIEALQRSFNDIKMDAVSGYERVQKAPGAGIADDHVTTTPAEASCRCTTACDCQAFVATTPGAAGQAALLNLRHSFLWLKPSDASTDASQSILTDHDKRPNTVDSGSDDGDSSGDALHHESQQKLDADILVLEPDIKAHFVISRPTARYRRLMDALPVHFVGTHKRLVELVEFVCGQMLVSFRENGLSVPPWRKNKSILSKWPLPTVTSRSQPPTPTRTPSVFAGKGVSARQISGFGARAGANMCPQRQQQWPDGRQAGPLQLPANGHQQLHQPQHNDHDSNNQCLSATLALYRLEEMRLAQLPEKATTDITDGSLVRAPPGAGAQAA